MIFLPEMLLSIVFAVFREFPDTDMVMFTAKGFGLNSEHFNRVQPEGVKDVIRSGKGIEVQPNIIAFGQDLFPALLKKVPIAFQRVMLRKEIWESISQLRRQIYCLYSSASDEIQSKKKSVVRLETPSGRAMHHLCTNELCSSIVRSTFNAVRVRAILQSPSIVDFICFRELKSCSIWLKEQRWFPS